MAQAFAHIAFTQAVRTMQEQQGSAAGYARFLDAEGWQGDRLSAREAAFIAARDGFFQATVSETGWPYVQFRGGPAGFLRVLDDRTVAYADFRGNRQYLSAGNLTGDNRISLILVDYPKQRRLKIWGRATLSDDPDLIAMLHDRSYRARPERAVVITVEAFDWNCPQHIPRRMTAAEFEPHLAALREQIAELTARNETLEAQANQPA